MASVACFGNISASPTSVRVTAWNTPRSSFSQNTRLCLPFFCPPSSRYSSTTHHYHSSPLQTPTFLTRIQASPSESGETEGIIVSKPEGVIEPEATQLESSIEIPRGEEVFAVVMVGSRQYIVFPGRYLYVQRLKGANVNDKIVLNKVLLVSTKSNTYIGKPIVENAAVHAVVEENGLNRKVIVFKYKKRKNYRRNIGHRQPNTRIKIMGITGYQDAPAAAPVPA